MSDMYEETVASLRDTLTRNGFVRCDIPACNCGSWHHRYGLPERFEQIRYMLAEAGYELCNENGHLVSKALAQLINDLAAAKEDADYAWRNVRILEAARVEEMRKRDARTELLRRTLPMLSGAGAGILAAEICECIAMHSSMASVRTTNSVGRTLESGSGHL